MSLNICSSSAWTQKLEAAHIIWHLRKDGVKAILSVPQIVAKIDQWTQAASIFLAAGNVPNFTAGLVWGDKKWRRPGGSRREKASNHFDNISLQRIALAQFGTI